MGVQRIPSGGGSRPVNGGPVCSGPPPGQRSFVAGESLSPHLYVGMPEPASRAVPLLEHARALEGDYAAAHGLLALCHEILFVRAGFKQDNRVAAIRHARAAVTHGRDDAMALSLGAFVIGMVEHDRPSALEAFERAQALSPSSAFTLFAAGAELQAPQLRWRRSDQSVSSKARQVEPIIEP